MKRYRLTKITVKTREIVSMSKDSADESQTPVCPVCHSPLAAVFHSAEKKTAELSSADLTENRSRK